MLCHLELLLLRFLALCAVITSLGTGYAADLSVLSFQVEPIYDEALDETALKKIAATLEKRINAKKQVADVSPVEKNRLQIKFKGQENDERERVQKLVETAGGLEFLITANERDHEKIRDLAVRTKDRLVRDGKRAIVAQWVDVDSTNFDHADEKKRRSGALFTRKTDRGEVQALVVVGQKPLRGEQIKSAEVDFDNNGFPTVKIVMTAEGADRMEKLTTANQPEGDFQRRLGIILNGRLVTAPNLFGVIRTEAVLTGRFTERETEMLAANLNALHLPLPVRFKLVDQSDERQTK